MNSCYVYIVITGFNSHGQLQYHILCLWLRYCYWLWCWCFPVSSLRPLTAYGCYEMHVLRRTTCARWKQSLVHYILHIIMVISKLPYIWSKEKNTLYLLRFVANHIDLFSWHICRITFAIAEACLIAGATKNAYHTKYRDMVYAGNWTCQTLRKGVFIAGAVFVVFTMILDVYFYMYYAKATNQAAKKNSKTTPSVGMTGYAWATY